MFFSGMNTACLGECIEVCDGIWVTKFRMVCDVDTGKFRGSMDLENMCGCMHVNMYDVRTELK